MERLRLILAGGLLLAVPMTASCDSHAVANSSAIASRVDEQLPKLTGRVVDNAELLAPSVEAQLTRRLAALETRTTDQLVVVTVPTLGGREIEQFGLQLGNAWGIGQKGKNNGVLLIVAPNERKVRIEVGLGLESTLTDPVAAEIIQARILPRFRQRDMEQGIVAGVDGILEVLDAGSSAERKLAA